jgi:hypothetical protein
MRMNSANQPSISASAALTVSVTSAVRHRQYGLPSTGEFDMLKGEDA